MDIRLTDKRALVTGASSGIGKAVALALADAALNDLLAKIPLGRLGQAEEVAAMAVVLSSDAASYVTGTTVVVDGGMTLYPSFRHGG